MADFDFLQRLTPITPATAWKAQSAEQEFFFQIATDEATGRPVVSVVNREGKSVDPSWQEATADEAAVLQLIDKARATASLNIRWDRPASVATEAVDLWDNPMIAFRLARCPNVRLGRKTVKQAEGTATIVLRLSPAEGKGMLTPSLHLKTPSGAVDDSPLLLSDSFAIASERLYAIAPLGDNFPSLGHFLSDVPQTQLSEYLSLLFSYIANIDVDHGDYTLEQLTEPAQALPTIVIEKVDTDKALYLRLTRTVGALNPDFAEQFELTRYASLTDDNRIAVRPVVRASDQQLEELLMRKLKEAAPNRTAFKEVYQNDGLFIVPEETAGPFLLGNIASLLNDFRIIGADRLKDYRVKAVAPRLKVALKPKSGIDFLEGTAEVELDGQTFTLADLLAQYRANRYVQLADGNRAVLDEAYYKRLQRIFHPRGKGGKEGDEIKVSFFDLPEIEALLQGTDTRQEAFKRPREFYAGFNALRRQKLKLPQLNATLRPYQQEGIKWARYLYDNSVGGCLADDMGLGKTIQAIGLLAQIYPEQSLPTLVVMPKSLIFNWEKELERFAPQLDRHTYYGPQRDLQEAMRHKVILTTYATVRNDIDTLRQQKFDTVILDESQNIKTLTTQTSRAVCLLDAPHRLALSGTPIENNLSELYSLFRFLNPAMFGDVKDFNTNYLAPIQNGDDKETREALRRKIFPFMLRRVKKDVLKELPERIEQTLYVEMEGPHAAFYEARRRHFKQLVDETIASQGVAKSQFVMFQALNELRRIASVPESLSDGEITSPKLSILSENLQELAANGHKTVVFFNYIAGIELLGEMLDQAGIEYATMTGSTRDRQTVVERFQTDPRCRVLLMTLKTGGVGLNLTAADTVFIVEPWWNRAAEEQAINRLHRIGQKANVLSYSMITRNTIEEKIRQLQQQKAELFEGVISADTAFSKNLSESDIKFILG